MRTAVVTGANRGIGLAIVRALLARGDRVVATCRRPDYADALRAVLEPAGDDGVLVPLDVCEPRSAAAAATTVDDLLGGVDLLVNNAGVWAASDRDPAASSGPLAALDADAVTTVLRTNAVGALVTTQAFSALLARVGGGLVANVTSGLGSLDRGAPRQGYAYAMSKAALNMATRHLAAELASAGVDVIAFDPGWVRTDLGGQDARLSPDEAATGLLTVIDGLPPETTDVFLNRRGERVPW